MILNSREVSRTASDTPVAAVAKATILIVDDIASNRDFLVLILRHHGYRVFEAVDGRDGLAMVRSERPDMVITDVLMPVMDGYELLRQLRLDPSTSRIPVVFYTAHYGEREAKALAISSGVSHVLTKPVTSAEVLEVVARMLNPIGTTAVLPELAPLTTDFDRKHLRLLTDKLSEKVSAVMAANGRLTAVINIGTELGSEEDAVRRMQKVCDSARDLFHATYVTIGILDTDGRTVTGLVTSGTDVRDWMTAGNPAPGVFGRTVGERRAFRGGNFGGDPARLGLPLGHPEVQAFLVAPIASLTRVYGWICLVGNEGTIFTEDDEHLLMVLSGQVGRISALEHEIIDRKQAEFALRFERDRTQRYLDAAGVILLALDNDGRITLVNRYACTMLGWTAEELLGREWVEACVPLRTRDALRARFANLFEGDLSIIENPVLTRSGDERVIEWRNTLLRDGDGQVIGTLSSGSDTTERQQAVEALRTAEERFRFALEAAGVGVWDMDYATGTLGWSEIQEAQYGLEPRTFLRTMDAFVERVHPQDRDSLLETLTNASRSGKDFATQHRAVWPDGTVRWLTGAGRIHLGEHGQPVRGLGISLDITDRRKLEEQYLQAQKMEAVGRLAGGVAHDFNNLLTVILGNCELLLADLDPQDPRQRDIAEIQKAGSSAATVTRQLLAFSRKQIIEPIVLDLNDVVTHVKAMIARLIGEDIKMLLGLRPRLSPVKADRGQIEQIILNLAVNARDAMPKGGTLTIETANVEFDEDYVKTHLSTRAGPYVALTVSDTGTGMTPQVQARLFEPFFTTKEVGKGTGLGLATVHGIATAGGGSVAVSSELGRGTSFTVYFPRADSAALPVDASVAASRQSIGAETVLVVEDADGLRALIKRILERQGYTVLVAANADEAIRKFESNSSIDVLLTDVVMPGASGPELTTRLLEKRPTLKVVYMSGYTEESIVHHGVLNPGIAFLHKPFTSESLGNKIREVLDA